MAIGTPTHLGSAIGAPATTATTGSFTPAASIRMFLQTVIYRNTAVDAPVAVITDSEGGTWTEITAASGSLLTAAQSVRQQIWTKQAVASPVSMTVTVTATGATSVALAVCSVSGCSSDFSNIASAINSSGDPAPTLGSSPASTSKPLAWWGGRELAGNVVAPTGYTTLAQVSSGSVRHASHYFSGTPPASAAIAWVTSNTLCVGAILEVKEDVAAVTGTVASQVDLSSDIAGSPIVTGTVDNQIDLSAAIAGSPLVAGAVAGSVDLPAAIAGSPIVTGTVAGTVELFPEIAGTPVTVGAVTGTVAGTVGLVPAIVGSPIITGTVAGTVLVTAEIAGTAALPEEDGVWLRHQEPFIMNVGRMM